MVFAKGMLLDVINFCRMSIPLLVLGDFAWDVMIRTNTELLTGGDAFGEVMLAPGGSAANVAVWARRCGLDTTFIGKIGRDRFGQLAKENLQSEKVLASFVETDAQLTGSVAVWIDGKGERSMVSGKGADHYLLPSELPKDLLGKCNHLHLTAWSFFADPPRTAARQAAKLAKSAGATISFDPGSFQLIQEMGVDTFLSHTRDLDIDLFLPNKEEGAVLSGETEPVAIAEVLAKLYPTSLIALKLDAQGALIRNGNTVTWISPATNHLIDATGAGDSFAGAFLARYLRGQNPEAAARFATKISAWVIQHLGARSDPDLNLRKLLVDRSNSDC